MLPLLTGRAPPQIRQKYIIYTWNQALQQKDHMLVTYSSILMPERKKEKKKGKNPHHHHHITNNNIGKLFLQTTAT